MKSQPVVIVLAAGLGSRFKGSLHKLAQPLGAATVLGQTISHAIESHLPVIVVTTERLAAEAARWVASRDVVLLPEVGRLAAGILGMGHSIATGVAARPQAGGWLVLPGDMPLVKPATLVAVAAGLTQHAVVYAQHLGRRGHPVGFSAELFSELLQLQGDDGARRVAARYPSVGLETADPGVLFDIDTQADLISLHAATAQAGASLPRADP